MVYKNFTTLLIVHLLIIVSLSFLAGYLVFITNNYPVVLFIGLVILLEGGVLLNSFNRTNRSLSYFFECIENEDTQLNFPTRLGNKAQQRLHESMNRVNKLISTIKMQNACNEQYYLALIQQSATGLIAMDPSFKVEVVNNKACELAGVGVSRNFGRLSRRNPELWSILCNIRSGETVTCKIFLDGMFRYLSISATEMRLQDKVTKLISMQDIKQELETKEVESWQKLISILTHEIMNSIAPITSLSSTLRKFFKKDAVTIDPCEVSAETICNTIQGLDIIEERGNGLMNFVSNYRRLTKIPPPVFADIPAYEWLDNFRILLHEKLSEKGITLDIGVDSRTKILYGDVKLLTQVLINIANNAIDALAGINHPGKIGIHVERKSKNQVQISISNNGPAIPKELLDQIFVPFFTTKETGSGIGLSLSRQIIQLHNGYMFVESEESGTRFIIVL